MPTTFYALLDNGQRDIEGLAEKHADGVIIFESAETGTLHFFGQPANLHLLGVKAMADAQELHDGSLAAKVCHADPVQDAQEALLPIPLVHYRIAVLSGRVDTQLCPNTGDYGTYTESAVTCPACRYLLAQAAIKWEGDCL